MATPNTEALFAGLAIVQWLDGIRVGNTTKDITTGTSYLLFTADATNGSFVKELRVKVDPTINPADNILRIWRNNGSTITVAANSSLFGELALILAVGPSATNALPEWRYPLGFAMPPSYRIYGSLSRAATNQAFSACVIGGLY
jgi:hypothetical protein